MGRWSRVAARRFVPWIGCPAGARWLDVGCGTGALLEAITDLAAPAEAWGVDESGDLVAIARLNLPRHAERILAGDAQHLPAGLSGFDAVVSGLMINLVPEPERALQEMIRAARVSGIVGAYVWDFAGRMEMVRWLWDTAAACDQRARELDQALAYPLCREDRLRQLFAAAGLESVETMSFDIPTLFRDFDDYWQPMLSGYGRAAGYVMSLTENDRHRLREQLRASLPARPDGTILLRAGGWGIRGLRPDRTDDGR